MDEQLLTVEEVAFIMNVSTQTVRKLIKNHQLLAVKLGRNYRISWEALNNFLRDKQGQIALPVFVNYYYFNYIL